MSSISKLTALTSLGFLFAISTAFSKLFTINISSSGKGWSIVYVFKRFCTKLNINAQKILIVTDGNEHP